MEGGHSARRIYHAGDTDVIPEMASIQTDIALLPVSGTYVMTADEAVTAAKALADAGLSKEEIDEIVAYIEQEAKKYGFEYIEMDKELFGDVTEEVMKSLGLSAR